MIGCMFYYLEPADLLLFLLLFSIFFFFACKLNACRDSRIRVKYFFCTLFIRGWGLWITVVSEGQGNGFLYYVSGQLVAKALI